MSVQPLPIAVSHSRAKPAPLFLLPSPISGRCTLNFSFKPSLPLCPLPPRRHPCPEIASTRRVQPPVAALCDPFSGIRYQFLKCKRFSRNIARRYTTAADSIVAAERLGPDGILGSDMRGHVLGSRSTVQDLPIPAAPAFTSIPPLDLIASLSASYPAYCTTDLHDMLSSVRAEVSLLASSIRGTDTDATVTLTALLDLLHLARFHTHLPPRPLPPSPHARPVRAISDARIDGTLLHTHPARVHPLLEGARMRPSADNGVLVAARGVGVARRAGALLDAKTRSVERVYLGWVTAPVRWAARWSARLRGHGAAGRRKDGETPWGIDGGSGQGVVRRVFPTVKIKVEEGWSALFELLLPIVTQEPTHKLCALVYREREMNLAERRAETRKAIRARAHGLVARAVDPVGYSPGRSGVDSVGNGEWTRERESNVEDAQSAEVGRLRVEVYQNVGWDTVAHVYPAYGVRVVPMTADILRVDLLTLAGLVSCGLTLYQDVDKFYVGLSAVATACVYLTRIGLGVRQALTRTRCRLAEEKAERVVAADEGAVAYLTELAIEQVFYERAMASVRVLKDDV